MKKRLISGKDRINCLLFQSLSPLLPIYIGSSQPRFDIQEHWKTFLNPTRSEPTTGGPRKDSSRQGAKLAKAPPLFPLLPLRLCARIRPLTDSNRSTFHWVANPCNVQPGRLTAGSFFVGSGSILRTIGLRTLSWRTHIPLRGPTAVQNGQKEARLQRLTYIYNP